jgi:hypothetical protein
VEIPEQYSSPTAPLSVTPSQVINAFISANDGLSPKGITVDCDRTRLREVRICFTHDDLAGTVRDKSTWARLGLAVQNTHLDPGWPGWLTLELSNHSDVTIEIARGEPIAQIVFEMLDQPTEQPYRGKYYDQARGPQPARHEELD